MPEQGPYGFVWSQVRAAEHTAGTKAADIGSMCLVRHSGFRPNAVHPVYDIRPSVDPLQLPGNPVHHVDLV